MVPSPVFVFLVWGFLARSCFSGRKSSFCFSLAMDQTKTLTGHLTTSLLWNLSWYMNGLHWFQRVLRKVVSQLLCPFELHYPSLTSVSSNFSPCDLVKPFCSLKCHGMSQQQISLSLALCEMGQRSIHGCSLWHWALSHSDHHLLFLTDCSKLIGCFQPKIIH